MGIPETPRMVKKPGAYKRVENATELEAALLDGWVLRLDTPAAPPAHAAPAKADTTGDVVDVAPEPPDAPEVAPTLDVLATDADDLAAGESEPDQPHSKGAPVKRRHGRQSKAARDGS